MARSATKVPPADVELRYRTVHGYQRAYRMAGSGPALLLIHGISDDSESWLPVMGRLAEHHTVIAPDLLGHGASDKPRADYSVAAFSRRQVAVRNERSAAVPSPWVNDSIAEAP